MRQHQALAKLRSSLNEIRCIALAGVTLLLAANAFAQEEGGRTAVPLVAGAMGLIFLLFFAAVYVYFAIALQTIAKKTNTENGWLAWIPILNIILMLNIGKKPLWWIILFLIPIVNVAMAFIVWMAIAEARSKPSWWGILIIVPIANLVVPGYLAWAD